MLKLKFQYFGHLMRRTESFEETLMLREIEVWRRRGWQRTKWLDGITDSVDTSLSKQTPGVGYGQGGLACCSPWGHKESDTTEWLNWTERHRSYQRKYSFPQIIFNILACFCCNYEYLVRVTYTIKVFIISYSVQHVHYRKYVLHFPLWEKQSPIVVDRSHV